MEGAKEDLVDMFIVHTMSEIQASRFISLMRPYFATIFY